jgi:hypothetical protein
LSYRCCSSGDHCAGGDDDDDDDDSGVGDAGDAGGGEYGNDIGIDEQEGMRHEEVAEGGIPRYATRGGRCQLRESTSSLYWIGTYKERDCGRAGTDMRTGFEDILNGSRVLIYTKKIYE